MMTIYSPNWKRAVPRANGRDILRPGTAEEVGRNGSPKGLVSKLDRPPLSYEVGPVPDLQGDGADNGAGRSGRFPWTYAEAVSVAGTIRRGTRPTYRQETLLSYLGIDSVRIYNDFSQSRAFSRVKGAINLRLCAMRRKGTIR